MRISRRDNIAKRLPHYYRTWDEGSSVSSVISSAGESLDEAEKDLAAIMKAHWVDTASGYDLDRLGMIYGIRRYEHETDPDLRNRIVNAVVSYKGGGTMNAIRMLMRIAMNLAPDYPLEIIENPEVTMKGTWDVRASSRWTVDPGNIADTTPRITITVLTGEARITDPTITNLTTGEKIIFRGQLGHGDVLNIAGGKATLNGADHTSSLSPARIPSLPRIKTEWQYTESIGGNIGVFDEGMFDRSVFSVDIVSAVTMEWSARRPATFLMLLPKAAVSGPGFALDYLQDVLDSIKACGVRAEIKVI